MLLARAFDTKISSLYKAGKITGGVYLGRGHEAIAACGGVFLTAGYDVIAPFIREQAARVTWGEPIIEAARAYLGSALGYMKGRDGNVHRGLPAEGYMAPISHLGSTVAFVIGCLFAKRLDGKLPGPVGVAFCGDGTTSTGAFHEAANMANVERLPLVLVVTNNQFAYSTPNIREFGEASLADRGRGYGFTVHETDGTDFMATLETFRTAVNNAREGRGPQWVLAKTLRMCGHGEHDDASYIPRELKEEYEKKDPVAVAERQLLAAGWLTPEETAMQEMTVVRMQQECTLPSESLCGCGRGEYRMFHILAEQIGCYELSFDVRAQSQNDVAQLSMTIYRNRSLMQTISLKGSDCSWRSVMVDLGMIWQPNFYLKCFFSMGGIEVQNAVVRRTKTEKEM